jgi:hypothetical protein
LPRDAAWRLEGAAVFLHETGPAQLVYRLACDGSWRTHAGEVYGWVAARAIDVRIARTGDGCWTLGGAIAAGLEDCIDLDFGFTPASNLTQIRRVALEVGQAALVPVAWLDLPACTLTRLEQRYTRRTGTTYWYEAPRFQYAALLEVDPRGFIHAYPGLWQAEALEGSA